MPQRILISIAALSLFLVGCSGEATPDTEDVKPTDSAPSTKTDEGGAGSDGGATAVSFTDIQSVFTANCVGCHGAGGNMKGGIDLTSHEGAMKGGEHGAIINPGDAAGSTIVKALRGNGAKQMPMMADALPEETIAKVEAWINAGAKSE